MPMTLDEAKHVAGSLRIVAVGQFATIGYRELVSDSPNLLYLAISAGIYLLLELAGVKLIGRAAGE